MKNRLPKRLLAAAAIAAGTVLLVFYPGLRAGLYMDDYSFLMTVRSSSAAVWDYFLHYVPGRNLQIPFFWALDRLTGGSPPALHAIFLLTDMFSAVLVCLLAWELTGLALLALPAALIFALLPNHGETHFWLTQFVQCQIPTSLTLLALVIAAWRGLGLKTRMAASIALYVLALFTYDQVFFLWPLLFAVLWHQAGPEERRPTPFLTGAVLMLALNLTHVLMRHLSEKSYGGRPVITWHMFLDRTHDIFWQALKGTFALPSPGRLPHWGWTVALALCALALGWLLTRLMRRWAGEEQPSWTNWRSSPGPLRLMAFGAAWFLLAYLPNFFWYLSPRHNYLPSLGWALFWTGAIALFTSGRPLISRVCTALAVWVFANAVVANVHEGSEWAYTNRLHQAYLREATRTFARPDNIFLIGAPRYIKKAPAFHQIHDPVLSVALAEGLGGSIEGDYQITPTRSGAFYTNDLSMNDRAAFRWMPFARMNAVAYVSGETFLCVRGLRLRRPDGAEIRRRLRPAPGCWHELRLDLDVALVSARETPLSSRPGRSVPNIPGLTLSGLDLETSTGLLRLTMDWAAGNYPDGDFAVVPSIFAQDGALLFEPVYPSPTAGRKTPVIWPLFNDERPASGWVPGRGMRETYLLRTSRPLPAGPCRVRLEIYRISPARQAEKAGVLDAAAVLKGPVRQN